MSTGPGCTLVKAAMVSILSKIMTERKVRKFSNLAGYVGLGKYCALSSFL